MITKIIINWRPILLMFGIIICGSWWMTSSANEETVANEPCVKYYGQNPYDSTKINGKYVLPVIMQYSEKKEDRGVQTGDVNADGLEDFILSYQNGYDSCYLQKVFINNGQGRWVEDPLYNIPTYFTGSGCWGTYSGDDGVKNNGIMMIDINNDGYIDIYKYIRMNTTGEPVGTNIYLNKADGTGWEYSEFYSKNFPKQSVLALPCHISSVENPVDIVLSHPLDVNGDGFFDIVSSYMRTNDYSTESSVYINQGDGTWSTEYSDSQY